MGGQASLQPAPLCTLVLTGPLPVLSKCLDDARCDLWRDLEGLQRLAQPVRYVFLPEARESAFAAMPGASVVDILLLLDLARDHASVIGAVHQASEGDVALRGPRSVVTVENSLRFAVCVRIHEHWLGARVGLPTHLNEPT